MESDRHIALKRLAAAYLIHTGFAAAATEVRAPASRYRVDAAGYLDRHAPRETAPTPNPTLFAPAEPRPKPPATHDPRTVIIECKQARADFLRDRRNLPALLRERSRLESRRERIEARLREERPDLRRSGSFLFGELEAWNFDAVSHGGYRSTLRDLRRLHRQIHTDTKFFLAAQHQLADRLYLLAPMNLIAPSEIPAGWGLLETTPALISARPPTTADLLERFAAGEQLIRVRRRAPDHSPTDRHRDRLLRNIAARASAIAFGRAIDEHTRAPQDSGRRSA